MALPNISCSNTYFPAGQAQQVSGGSFYSEIVNKGGGGYLLSKVGKRPYIPIAGMKLNAGTQERELLTVAQNKAFMGLIARDYFISALNASANYALDLTANPDQILPAASDENFYGYLYKRVYGDGDMTSRYNYIADMIYNFWLNADAAWTTAQYEAAIRDFKIQMQQLADRNLFLINGLNIDAASVLAVQILAFKTATPALQYFDCLELQLS